MFPGKHRFAFLPLACMLAVLPMASCSKSSTVARAEDGSIIGHLRQLSNSPPLYELRYEAPYEVTGPVTSVSPDAPFACTCFSAVDASGNRVMGRNFDWIAHPIMVLITKPAGGYASISVIDMTYTWRLVDAPRWPFDGMNEHGLAVGMLMIDEARSACELGMTSISSFGIIRIVLDNAATLDEAVALMGKYFVTFGGKPIHYFIADRSGASAVVEYFRGELRVFRAEKPWQVTTNFTFSKTPDALRPAMCWRYALVADRLLETGGSIDAQGVFGLLEEVSQPNTVWSSSYDLTATRLTLALGRKFDKTYSWKLSED